MPKQPNILFIHLGESSFVKEDLRILGKLGHLNVFYFSPSKSGFQLLKNFFVQFFWLISRIRKADFIYCWFSDYHAFLPTVFGRLFKVPVITVLGGLDCIKMPHLNYGIFCSWWRKPIGSFVLKNSSLLLPVNDSLIETYPIAEKWPDAHPNGVRYNVPNFTTSFRELATGYDASVWEMGALERDKTVLTVAACSTLQIAKRKGLDLFIGTSKLLPEFSFSIVGVSEPLKQLLIEKYAPGENVHFIPRQKRESLNHVYTQSSVYLQLSRAEGLPNVLCEAMMCGCVPVGSPVFGIPHGIGDTGFIAKTPDPMVIAPLVLKAHNSSDKLRQEARQRVIENFSLELRTEKLFSIFNSYKSV